MNRRNFLVAAAAAGVAIGTGATERVSAAERPAKTGIKAIAFDAFPVFDPRPIFALAERLFPGKGAALGSEWRARVFEYTWLRVAAGRYADFWQVTRDALTFAAKRTAVELSASQRDELMNAWLGLKAWPDTTPALTRLKAAGYRLALLSNLTPAMLDACIRSAALGGTFDRVLSTDQARTYKPDPRAYRLAADAFKLEREEILFVAYAGWDAAGAKLFGYPTFWVNRLNLPAEELDAVPDGSGADLSGLAAFLAQ